MKLETRVFGEIDVDEEKMIHFEDGIIGFPDCKSFALIFDAEGDSKDSLCWLQSIEEPIFAMPVINPLLIQDDYSLQVDDETLKKLGLIEEENLLVLVTVTIPTEIQKLSVNLKAPIVINAAEHKAIQLIVDDELPVKFYIYDILQAKKKAGE
ncbi:flagellar assembly factor FliW [Clostridia bacterium]|nr:flagellar assembly factor FliW [Clostridia bacterium]